MAVTNEERVTRPFTEFLAGVRKGKLSSELGEALADLLLAVGDTGKAGTLTLTLSAKPVGKSDAIELIDKVTLKVPDADKAATIVYADASGNPLRNDPRQPELDGLKVAEPVEPAEATKPLKEAK